MTGELSRERAALLADGRREAGGGARYPAPGIKQQASSEDSTEKFQGQGRPTQAAGSGQVPTGVRSAQPFPSRGAQDPSSTPR